MQKVKMKYHIKKKFPSLAKIDTEFSRKNLSFQISQETVSMKTVAGICNLLLLLFNFCVDEPLGL